MYKTMLSYCLRCKKKIKIKIKTKITGKRNLKASKTNYGKICKTLSSKW